MFDGHSQLHVRQVSANEGCYFNENYWLAHSKHISK